MNKESFKNLWKQIKSSLKKSIKNYKNNRGNLTHLNINEHPAYKKTTLTKLYRPRHQAMIKSNKFKTIMEGHIIERIHDIQNALSNGEPQVVNTSVELCKEDYAILIRFTSLNDEYEKFSKMLAHNQFYKAKNYIQNL